VPARPKHERLPVAVEHRLLCPWTTSCAELDLRAARRLAEDDLLAGRRRARALRNWDIAPPQSANTDLTTGATVDLRADRGEIR
jgi:hypothetical protein